MILSRVTRRRKALVLLAVLVVVVLLSLASYRYSEFMMAEFRAADSHARALQARSAAESGIWFAASLLGNPDNLNSLSGNPWDNPSTFQDVAIGDTGVNGDQSAGPNRATYFSLVTVRDADDPAASSQPYRFGVCDESGKINLNSLLQVDSSGNTGSQILMMLPNMTQDVANAILDWMDADDTTRQDGAENDFYSTQSPPYQCKNGPFDSLEELLLVKGVTPQLLFGNDRNRNGILDPGEDNGEGQVDRGWSAYLTVYSRESNVDAQGTPRIYINDTNLTELSSNLQPLLGQELTNYIIAYRLYGGTQSSGDTLGRTSRTSQSDTSAANSQIQTDMANSASRRLTKISSLYDLVNSTVSVTVSSNAGGRGGAARTQRSVTIRSPLQDSGQQQQYLPVLLDETTTSAKAEIPARVNVNTASQVVLSTLPGLSGTDVQAILTNRPQLTDSTAPDPSFQSPAWLITRAGLTVSKLKTLEKYITARTQVYRVQSLGYSSSGGPVSRLEAVIDTNLGRPRVLAWRDLSELGKAFDVGGTSSSPP